MRALRQAVRRPVSQILLGSAAGQGIVLAASPLLTRIYGPEAFGALAVLTALASVASVIATLRWEAGMVLPKNDADSKALAWLGMTSALVFSVVMTVVILIWPSTVNAIAGNSASTYLWWILPLTVIAIGFHKILSAWMIRTESYTRLGQRNLFQGLGQLAIQLGLGLASVKPTGLLLGLAAGRIAGIGGVSGRGGVFDGGLPSWRRIIDVASKYRRYPLITAGGSFVNALGLQAPILILAASYGALEFGMVALTIRVLATPVGIVADAVAQYFEAQTGKLLRVDSGGLLHSIYRTTTRLALVAICPTAIVIILGPPMFAFIFGEEWRQAGEFARVLVASYFVQFIVSPVSRTLVLLQKQTQQALWDGLRAFAVIGAVLFASSSGMNLLHAIFLMAGTHIACYLVLMVMSLRCAKSYDRLVVI